MTTAPNFAASRKVNPANAQLRLTAAQVWKGLEIKSRDPALFIPQIASCRVLEDSGNAVTREVAFKGGPGPPMIEDITIHPDAIIYFNATKEGFHITNILSYDEEGELVLTFSFAGGIPGVPPSAELPTPEELNKRVGGGIEHTIQIIRNLVQNGTIAMHVN